MQKCKNQIKKIAEDQRRDIQNSKKRKQSDGVSGNVAKTDNVSNKTKESGKKKEQGNGGKVQVYGGKPRKLISTHKIGKCIREFMDYVNSNYFEMCMCKYESIPNGTSCIWRYYRNLNGLAGKKRPLWDKVTKDEVLLFIDESTGETLQGWLDTNKK